MSCDKDAILAAIQRQISSGSPCEDNLSELLEAFWELAGMEAGCTPLLQALITKLEAITYLMGCEAYSVDTREEHYQMNHRVVADSKSDTVAQSQSTGSSSKFSRGSGTTRYDETSTAQSDGHNTRIARGSEVGDGSSFYRDDGKGYGYNNSSSNNSIMNSSHTVSENRTHDTGNEDNHNNECNYEYSTNNTNGAGDFFAIMGVSASGTASEWRKYHVTHAQGHAIDDHLTTTRSMMKEDGETLSSGNHDWNSYFYSDIEWTETDTDVRDSRDRSDRIHTAEAHAKGSGDGIAESRAESRATSQGTAKSETISSADREATRVAHRTAFELANSQRFRNLRQIYDQLILQIEHLKKRIRATANPQIKSMKCDCVSSCCCLPSYAVSLIEIGRAAYAFSTIEGCSTCTS